MENNQNQIIDAENYRGANEGLGFKDICMRQLQRVVTNMSQEMRQGFWIYSQAHPQMTAQKTRYIGDSRKELQQSINVLHDLLLPKFDKDMTSHSEKIYNEINDWHNKWLNKEVNEKEEGNYWQGSLKIYRKLFQQLCLFLERLGWLENSEVEE